jgi:hypothetical protein
MGLQKLSFVEVFFVNGKLWQISLLVPLSEYYPRCGNRRSNAVDGHH